MHGGWGWTTPSPLSSDAEREAIEMICGQPKSQRKKASPHVSATLRGTVKYEGQNR